MSSDTAQQYAARPLEQKYYDKNWYKQINDYMKIRYPPIASRLSNIFRYVDLDPKNKNTFSYEFSSILRDIGSTFSSICDSFVKGVNNNYEKQYTIDAYRKFLLKEMVDLEQVVVQLNIESEYKYVLPFRGFRGKKHSIFWWDAYNAVKHIDIQHLEKGSLLNVVYAFSALSAIVLPILYLQSYQSNNYTSDIIQRIDTYADPKWYRTKEFCEYVCEE